MTYNRRCWSIYWRAFLHKWKPSHLWRGWKGL